MATLRNVLVAVCFLGLALNAEAKWWIFGGSNDAVNLKYVYYNGVSSDEIAPKITLFTDALRDGEMKITGRATASKGDIGYVRISIDNKTTWRETKLSSNGGFEYAFKPETGKNYIIYLEAADTAGKSNDIELSRKEFAFSAAPLRTAVVESLDALSTIRNSHSALGSLSRGRSERVRGRRSA